MEINFKNLNMENKLLSMVDYIKNKPITSTFDTDEIDWYRYEWDKLDLIRAYADFLSQSLTLPMFVPTDKEGNILDAEPVCLGMFEKGKPFHDNYLEDKKQYDESLFNVIFEGFEYIPFGYARFEYNQDGECLEIDEEFCLLGLTIENLVKYNLNLTESKAKELGL